MPLIPVQVQFVNEVSRPFIERLIRIRAELDDFVQDYDNQQTPLPTDTNILDDNATGTAPRTDAPTVTGQRIQQMRNFSANMRDEIDAIALALLIQLSVRPLKDILRGL